MPPANDDYHNSGLNMPWDNQELIEPSDDDELANVSRALLITEAGTLKILTKGGQTCDYGGVTFPAFTLLWVRAKKVFLTGTTATVYNSW